MTLLSGLEVLKALALTSYDTVLSLTLDHVTGLTVTIMSTIPKKQLLLNRLEVLIEVYLAEKVA